MRQRGIGTSRFMTDEWGQANESEMESFVPIRLPKSLGLNCLRKQGTVNLLDCRFRGLEGRIPASGRPRGWIGDWGIPSVLPVSSVVKNPCFYHRGHRDHRD